MRIDLFRMERMQCLYENEVEYNLSESGVRPLRLEDLLEGEDPACFLSQALKYPPSNGSRELRERIAQFHGAAAEQVLVTNGGSEANYTALWGLLEKGDRTAVMLPNYLQTWGLARAYGGYADAFHLVERQEDGRMRWALDVESLRRAVTSKTRLIVVTNPNNPTGTVLTESEMEEVIRAARKVNAWLLADEIYRGAEVDSPMSPTFWGRYDKLLLTSGLSKAYGLPGLRIGWIVGPGKTVARLCHYRDYTTLTPTYLSDRLASLVMDPARRQTTLQRTRNIIREHLPRLEGWIHSHDDIFTYIPPRAGAIAFFRYKLPISSSALFNRLRAEQSVLITPGAHFGVGKYIRVGYGYDIDYTLKGLARLDILIKQLSGKSKASRGAPAVTSRRGAA
ncbi:MAG TPA: aminotransferase class I/II-fold pyridoxal phosphate-dependent enzyme [Terriglobales bacterium]|nr:aminotransferase class I/II-fold pyridoxal phosphate-dependent enzyme [Terriglobales bacterium]